MINIKPDTKIRVCVWGGGGGAGCQMFHFQVVALSMFSILHIILDITERHGESAGEKAIGDTNYLLQIYTTRKEE